MLEHRGSGKPVKQCKATPTHHVSVLLIHPFYKILRENLPDFLCTGTFKLNANNMFDFFLFNHNAMLRKNFGFGVSVRHINLLFYFTAKKNASIV
jgi:hypothetical protein